jgi:beta-fructofuranosidase
MAYAAGHRGTTEAESADRESRRRLVEDPHRPLYHFLPASNWMNDPNGLIQWDGKYHLFYQANPNGPFHGTIHWGHAVSEDLVYWRDLPVALTPTPGGPDEDGCYSGCAVDHEGVPTLIYTGVRGKDQRPCVATSRDGLITWEKHPKNPVIRNPPADLDLVGFRDHAVWNEDGVWYQLIGSGIKDVGGTVLLYRSYDLVNWEYLRPLLVGDKAETEPFWTGSMWECPDLLDLGDRHVLILSAFHEGDTLHTFCLIGSYEDGAFVPETGRIIDPGGCFYAPQTTVDDEGRRIMWGWLREGRPEQEQQEAGWSGVMSLPRLLSLKSDSSLAVEPVPELKSLRTKHQRFAGLDLTPESSGLLETVRGNCLELVAEFEPGNATEFGMRVCRSPAGEEETLIFYDARNGRLVVDPSRSSTNPDVHKEVRWDTVERFEGESLKLHVFIDRSVVEVFANGRACVTIRIYPTRENSLGLDLFSHSGDARLKLLDVWEMKGIGERRTVQSDATLR